MWSPADLKWLNSHYPTLSVIRQGVIGGSLTYRMLRNNGSYYVNPSQEQISNADSKDFLYLSDTYKIEIRPMSSGEFPMAFEVGGKIDAVGNKYGKSKIDMHKYLNDALCVATSMELERSFPDGVNLQEYVEDFLIPYMFAQTYYSLYGEWVWGDLSHGYLGLLEWLGHLDPWYDDDVELTYKWMTKHGDRTDAMKAMKRRWRSHEKCICKSGKKMRDCHPEIKRAISRIRIAINNGTLDTSKYPIDAELAK